MKTAEDWCVEQVHDPEKLAVDWIRKIQLDAMKEGARKSSKITSRYLENNRLHPDLPNEQLNVTAQVAAHSVLQQAAISIIIESDSWTENNL